MSEYHPLFLPEEGDDTSDARDGIESNAIRAIFICRRDPKAVRGLAWSSHGGYGPDELQSHADIFAKFGGGNYKLKATGPKGGYIGDRDFTLDGPQYPMIDPMDAQRPSASSAAAPPVAVAAPVLHQPGMFEMLMLMLKSSEANSAAMMQLMQQNSQQTMAMILGFTKESKEDSRAHAATQAGLVTKVLEMKSTAAPALGAPGERKELGDHLADMIAMQEGMKMLQGGVAAPASGVESVMASVKAIAEAMPHVAPMIAQMRAQALQGPQLRVVPNAPPPPPPSPPHGLPHS